MKEQDNITNTVEVMADVFGITGGMVSRCTHQQN